MDEEGPVFKDVLVKMPERRVISEKDAEDYAEGRGDRSTWGWVETRSVLDATIPEAMGYLLESVDR